MSPLSYGYGSAILAGKLRASPIFQRKHSCLSKDQCVERQLVIVKVLFRVTRRASVNRALSARNPTQREVLAFARSFCPPVLHRVSVGSPLTVAHYSLRTTPQTHAPLVTENKPLLTIHWPLLWSLAGQRSERVFPGKNISFVFHTTYGRGLDSVVTAFFLFAHWY